MSGLESDIELYPSEINACKEILASLYKEFLGLDNSERNLSLLRDTAISKFGRIGLKVSVDVNNLEMMDDGTIVTSPQIVIEGRFDDKPHDYERHSFEVQSGELDGVAGVITEKGFQEK